MKFGYPLIMDDEREFPEDYDGPVFIWDIDKTYLQTHFSSVRGLARIPLESAVDKEAIPGMPEVLRGLRKGPGPEYACAPLYFVSASPPQMQPVLKRKMLLDGVEYDGITSKDWLRTTLHLKPGRLFEQVGFKLCALLAGKINRPLAGEYLFGDDVEKDAEAFSLYSDLLDGKFSSIEARKRLAEEGVRRSDRRHVFALMDRLPRKIGKVKKIFIHLERNTPPEEFEPFGKLVVPVKGALQLSLTLYHLELVGAEVIKEVVEVLAARGGDRGEALKELMDDAVSRRLIPGKKLRDLKLKIPSPKT